MATNGGVDVGEANLRRELGIPLAVAVAVNATIGTGIFRTPGNVTRLAGSLEAAVFVWCLGAVLSLAGALSIAELAAAFPRTGGLYEYLRRAYGPRVAFLLGWSKLTLLLPSAVGSFARLAGEALGSLLQIAPGSTTETILALLVLVLCVAANLLSVRSSAGMQAFITALKYLGVLALAGVGLSATVHGSVTSEALPYRDGMTISGVFAALVSVMWAYDGWADLSSLAGEVRNPSRTLPRALALGTLTVALVYLLAVAGYARVLGLDGLRRSSTGAHMAAMLVASLTLGNTGRTALSVLIVLSCVGACMASLLTGSRMLVAMASDGLFFSSLGKVSPTSGVPLRGVLVGGLLGVLYVSFRSFEQLTEGFVVGYFPFYSLAVCAVYVLRRRAPTMERPFRVPLYPVTPLLFLAGAAALLWGALRELQGTAAMSFLVMALGLPVSFLWSRFAAPQTVK